MEASKKKQLTEILNKIQMERGGVANIHTAFSDYPEGLSAHYEFYKSIMLADNLPLPRFEREVLAFFTSEENECPYCINHHKQALEKSYDSNYNQQPRLDVLRKLSRVLTKEPWKSNIIVTEMLNEFSKAEIQHAVMIVSYFNMANRCAFAMNLQLEQNYKKTCN